MSIRLFNTLTHQVESFEPLTAGKVSMYHCGPTVYSSPHIGNFRSFLLADLLRRFFEDRGFAVHQVMNITDVGHQQGDEDDTGEDKVVHAARKAKLDPYVLTRKYEDEFRHCLEALHFRLPHEMPRATEHIAEMGEMIDRLLEEGYAYQMKGNVFFAIERFADYGKLSKKNIEELAQGVRIDVHEDKRDPRDFALWKRDEGHLMVWDAPFRDGVPGRPGWHIECSAMSRKYLGDTFDIHTGGEDNLFPHHECEVAQSEAFTKKPFVKTWLHVRHLMVEGQKMSKSLGNFTTVQDVLDRGYSGVELRYALIAAQYRQQLNFTQSGLDDARKAIQRVQEARARLARLRDGAEPAGDDALDGVVGEADAAFTAALEDDLNTSGALAAVFGLVAAVNKAQPSADAAAAALRTFARFEDVLACFGPEPATESAVPAELEQLLEQRQAARKAKDFAEADRLRDEISSRGYKIVDTPQGPRVEPV